MNYYALDEALAYINGEELPLSYYIESLSKFNDNLGDIFNISESVIVTEGAKEFFKKVKDAIVKFLKTIKDFFVKIGRFIKDAVTKIKHHFTYKEEFWDDDFEIDDDFWNEDKEYDYFEDEEYDDNWDDDHSWSNVKENSIICETSVAVLEKNIKAMIGPKMLIDFTKVINTSALKNIKNDLYSLFNKDDFDSSYSKEIINKLNIGGNETSTGIGTKVWLQYAIGVARKETPDSMKLGPLVTKILKIAESNTKVLRDIQAATDKLNILTHDLEKELSVCEREDNVEGVKIISRKLSCANNIFSIMSNITIQVSRCVGKTEALSAYIKFNNIG